MDLHVAAGIAKAIFHMFFAVDDRPNQGRKAVRNPGWPRPNKGGVITVRRGDSPTGLSHNDAGQIGADSIGW